MTQCWWRHCNCEQLQLAFNSLHFTTAVWSLMSPAYCVSNCKSSSDFVDEHMLTMCLMACCCQHLQTADLARCNPSRCVRVDLDRSAGRNPSRCARVDLDRSARRNPSRYARADLDRSVRHSARLHVMRYVESQLLDSRIGQNSAVDNTTCPISTVQLCRQVSYIWSYWGM